MDEKILAIWLSEALGPGSVYGKLLIEKYGSFEEIYKLGETDYEACGIKSGSAAMKRLLDKGTASAEKSLGFCEYNYFGVIDWNSGMYPKRLKAISNPPPVLYARGRMVDFDDNVCIGIVGTRSYSDAGWNSTYKIAGGIAECGAVVVTGLASGIDTAATRAALSFSGFAVGVLGSGIEKIYPSENSELFEEMYAKGLVISERAPFTDIIGKYFPVRNRLISGLCNGVLVGEGSVRSGAMISAAHACEQGRRVFAIPADISNPESTGVNKLIRDGATPVFEAWDVLKNYEYLYPHRIKNTALASRVSVPEERSTKKVRVLGGKRSAPGTDMQAESCQKEAKKHNDRKTEENIQVNKASPVFEKVYDINTEKLAFLNKKSEDNIADLELSPLAEKVYRHICSDDFKIADAIAEEIGEDVIEVSVAITTLEIAGLITTEGPKVRRNF